MAARTTKTLLALACALCLLALVPALASAAEPGGIEGTITDANSLAAIPGARVCARGLNGTAGEACALANADGEYEIADLPVGEYEVEFTGQTCEVHEIGGEPREECAPGWGAKFYDDVLPFNPPTPVVVTEDETTEGIDAELEETGGIAGTLESSLGGPAAHTVVCVNSKTQYFTTCTFTNADGEYEFELLPTGEYNVQLTGWVCTAGSGCEIEPCREEGVGCARNYVEGFYDEEALEEEADLVTVSAGLVSTGTDTTLTAAGRIEGVVTLAGLEGTPLEGFIACARSETAEVCGRTNAAGHYVVENLPVGEFIVHFEEPCDSGPCAGTYLSQFWNDQAEEEDAEKVGVIASAATTGIDAAIAEANPQAPAFTSPPVLNGEAKVGSRLDCSAGTWSHNPTRADYTWLRDGTAIGGQTSATYTVASADEGASLRCEVKVSNSAGSATGDSDAVSVPREEESSMPVTPATPTPVTPAPPAPPKEEPKPTPATAASTARASANGRTVSIKLTCSGKVACQGSLKLTYEEKTKSKDKTKVKKLTVGTVSFQVPAGTTRSVTVKLTSKGIAYLAEAGTSGLKVKLTGSALTPRTLTIKLAKKS